MGVFRCFVEKRDGFDVEAAAVFRDLRDFLGIRGLESLRVLCRYDAEGIPESLWMAALDTVFSEPRIDDCYIEAPPPFGELCRTLIAEPLPGQYDQRADSCVQCIQLLAMSDGPALDGIESAITVRTAKVYVLYGDISDEDMAKLRDYLINPVESREASSGKPDSLTAAYPEPAPVATLHGFITAGETGLTGYLSAYGLAMDIADLKYMQEYFRDTAKRDPTVTELRVIDTYWSDHCRHTTFNTRIDGVTISDPDVISAYKAYQRAREEVYGPDAADRPRTLMDIATIAAKALRARGLLENLDISDEINACSFHVDAEVDGITEDWLLSFKNETHNHPTEVEPFGGAATCIGGAVRDPLSGRAYVYQAMRITGAGDPRALIEDTMPGKLPQRKLTVAAAHGYSSYGNQIGIATGLVHELYHPGYQAKRMELGAVVGAVRADNVVRETPAPGDKVLLLGGRTGRDGIGGATGSSKTHTTGSHVSMASEVQKGNAPEERKIQRLFLDPEVSKMIKRCNDFGAGGVSVAAGELADGVDIDLSLIRRKYEGLDGTELAISESQERMAVVVAPGNVSAFIRKAEGENLEAYEIAGITEKPAMVMRHNGNVIVEVSRAFLSTNGAVKHASVRVPDYSSGQITQPLSTGSLSPGSDLSQPLTVTDRLESLVSDLRFCSRRGLQAMFDGTVGASSVLMKSGGKTQSTPVQAMASLLPVGFSSPHTTTFTSTCSVMAFGFDPYLSSENPFAGAKTAVVTSAAKLVASGCDPDTIFLSFQEYFERLRDDPERWGKPFSALLGAFEAQMELEIAAVGGKDSMSGSFNDIDVPPTLVSFAVAPNDARRVISPEFKEASREVVLFRTDSIAAPVKEVWRRVRALVSDKTIVSAWAVTEGGIAEGIFKMALGNGIGFKSADNIDTDAFFTYTPGSIIAEVTRPVNGAITIGRTVSDPEITIGGVATGLAGLRLLWESSLEKIFPVKTEQEGAAPKLNCDSHCVTVAKNSFAKPRALIFTFPGTNSEIDTARAVSRAGGVPKVIVIRNLTRAMLEGSIAEAAREIKDSQILIIPGGFSFGDEPDGSAKFIAAFFRNRPVADVLREHLELRDGLMLGVCNGFQALIKLGLVPFGRIVPPDEKDRPTLTHNQIGRHQACYVYTRVASVNSPWMSLSSAGDVHAVAVSHGEGRFIASEAMLADIAADGRIATQYSDSRGVPSMDISVNPNGSLMAVEGLFSPDGRVFGKMGHTERYGEHIAKNIYGNKHQPIFESGVNYFK